MEVIKKLSAMIKDELGDAEKYAKCALMYRDDRPELARVFDSISRQEMEHMQMLHTQVVAIIEMARQSGEEIPAGMEQAYELLHEMQIEEAAEVKILQSMFR